MFEDDNTYTITGGPLKPHEYVVIRREMTAADEAWVQNHSMKVGGTRKNPQVQMTIGDTKLALLKRMILRWQLTRTIKGAEGEEKEIGIELTEQAIENLPRRVSAYIDKKINELNPDDEEDDTDFTSAANGHSGGSLALMKTYQPKD